MDHREAPPISHQTSTQILKQTTTLFLSNLLLFLFLSSFIFTFRSNLESGTHYLTSFVESNPSFKSLLSRVTTNLESGPRHPPHHGIRRRPFLHLSRVGTLDDDFFSGDSNLDKSLFYPSSNPYPNSSSVILNLNSLGLFNEIIDNDCIFFPQAIRQGYITFNLSTNHRLDENDNDKYNISSSSNDNVDVDLQFFIKGLELGRGDATALLFLVSLLSAAYAYVVLAFLVTYTWVHGIVFLQVLDNVLGNYYRSIFRTVWEGSNLGLRRLSGFVLMRWAVRDALAQLLGIWVFGEIEDQYAFFQVFVRMKLMPFSDVAPWVKGNEKESLCFVVSWFLVELVVGFIFAVDSWVSIVDSRKSGREVVKEGCHLLGVMVYPAVGIKCWEVLVCGSFTRWILGRIFGEVFALAFQSVMEVYFMVAWLTFYLAARYNDASSAGRTFGRRELEGFLEGVR